MHPEYTADQQPLLRWESHDTGRTWQLPAAVADGAHLQRDIQTYVRSSKFDERLIIGGSLECTEGALCPGAVDHRLAMYHHRDGSARAVWSGCWCVATGTA